MSTIINATTTNGVVIQPDNSGSLQFQTNGTATATIDTSGNVGIGTNSPVTRLDVVGGTSSIRGSALFNTSSTAGTGSSAYIRSANAYSSATTPDYAWWFNDQCGLFHPASDVIGFSTAGLERMRIDSSGNVLVGNTAGYLTNAKLLAYNTNSANGAAMVVGSAWAGDVSSPAVLISKLDNNTTTSQVFTRFYINGSTACGQINANGASTAAFGTASDERLKENITDLPPQLNNIMSLRPTEFDYKDGSGHQIGFIAQEMQEIYPDVVGAGMDDMMFITGWDKTSARLVKAIQEQQTIINDLKARIETLEAK